MVEVMVEEPQVQLVVAVEVLLSVLLVNQVNQDQEVLEQQQVLMEHQQQELVVVEVVLLIMEHQLRVQLEQAAVVLVNHLVLHHLQRVVLLTQAVVLEVDQEQVVQMVKVELVDQVW
tara:strand:+ start:497 stop:847 length:351 start_codon:yes stop_codon:yes gene_type:complete